MTIPLYQIDAFTNEPFGGNPAAVCPLSEWLPDEVMQRIAAENNLSETAFFVRSGDHYDLRWFTPTVEVDLCGHATLASGFLVFTELDPEAGRVLFETRSGTLQVTRQHDRYELDLPRRPVTGTADLGDVEAAVGATPSETWAGASGLALFDSAGQIRRLRPDPAALADLDCRSLIVTAPGDSGADFVSRFFAPAYGILEDPVTGSAHCLLTPFWAERLGRSELFARQLSARGGELWCTDTGDRVRVGGQAVPVIRGELMI